SACAGYHVSNISELRIFKIISYEKIKGNYTRFYFLSGERALNNFIKKHKITKELNRFFSCKDDEINLMLNKFSDEKKQTETKFKELALQFSQILAPKLLNESIKKDNVSYIVYKDSKEIIEILNKLIPKNYVFIGIWDNGGVISSEAINCGEFLKKISCQISLKGGGNSDRANFKGETSIEEITNIL
ncbi:MAG: alanyl-tRNA editing protein, partial [Cetobacterium sp.]